MGNRLKMYVDIQACHSRVTGSGFHCNVKLPYPEEWDKFLVDFGLFNGESEDDDQEDRDKVLNSELIFDPSKLSFVLVTHNHVDHIGRLPMLVRNGFRGNIYATEITKKLLPAALYDSESIQSEEYKKIHKSPLYYPCDVNDTLSRVIGCKYNERIQVSEHIYATFIQNGHIPGSASILVEITYPNLEPINLFFSGDYAPKNDFFDVEELPQEIKDKRISALICESTYGTTCTKNVKHGKFKKILLDEIEIGKKNIILPVLSLQRAQQILYELKKLQDTGELDTSIPIYLDGRLAQKYTRIYLDEDFVKDDMKDFLPKNLTWIYKNTRGELLLNEKERKIIVSSSGMGTYGAARRYISYYCGKKDSTIIFNCFLSKDCVGRKLMNAHKGEKITIYGLVKEINCDVYQTQEFSSHAKKDELIDFLKQFSNLCSVIVNHGEQQVKEKFAQRVYDVIDTKSVGIIDRRYDFRVSAYGVDKTLPTRFTR